MVLLEIVGFAANVRVAFALAGVLPENQDFDGLPAEGVEDLLALLSGAVGAQHLDLPLFDGGVDVGPHGGGHRSQEDQHRDDRHGDDADHRIDRALLEQVVGSCLSQ